MSDYSWMHLVSWQMSLFIVTLLFRSYSFEPEKPSVLQTIICVLSKYLCSSKLCIHTGFISNRSLFTWSAVGFQIGSWDRKASRFKHSWHQTKCVVPQHCGVRYHRKSANKRMVSRFGRGLTAFYHGACPHRATWNTKLKYVACMYRIFTTKRHS